PPGRHCPRCVPARVRPPSSGRSSDHQTLSPSTAMAPSTAAARTTSSDVIGVVHEPYDVMSRFLPRERWPEPPDAETLRGLGQQLAGAAAAFAEVVVAEGERQAGIAGRAEGLAGHDRDPGVVEQHLAQLDGGARYVTPDRAAHVGRHGAESVA